MTRIRATEPTPRLARPTVRVDADGSYVLTLPLRDPYPWRSEESAPIIHAAVHGTDTVFVSTHDETASIQHAFSVTPAAAHALAEALHAVANRIEGKPADDDRPGDAG
ncbi:MAG TPA: hypothetical protein VGT60_06940 [Candidatus Limnocylindria bacterium]|nr:hypothetical protein [Candidatus Limnocylindria bacterium]